jgi:hypothetical protein
MGDQIVNLARTPLKRRLLMGDQIVNLARTQLKRRLIASWGE